MINLKLFTALQGDNTASLLLRPAAPGIVNYYLMSSNVNYAIATTGTCEGELPDDQPAIFDVTLSSAAPLIDKNYAFKFVYKQGVLQLVETSGKFSIEPQCIARISDTTTAVMEKLLKFTDLQDKYKAAKERYEDLQTELRNLKANYDYYQRDDGSGWVNSSSPFEDPDREQQKQEHVEKVRKQLEAREKEAKASAELFDKVRELDLHSFKRISNSASRANAIVEFHGEYAVHSLPNGYVFEKAECPQRALPGKLLQRMLREKSGKFYDNEGEIVFVSTVSSGDEVEEYCLTYVFLESFLPSYRVDSTLITKGAVLEQYKLNIKAMMDATMPVLSKFENMTFDLGNSMMILSNDRGEIMTYKFDTEDAKTIELNKLLRGEEAGEIVMSSIDVPRDIQRVINDMSEEFTVSVKKNKVVMQSNNFYVVFGR